MRLCVLVPLLLLVLGPPRPSAYLPVVLREHRGVRPLANKGCAGCDCGQLQYLGASASYVWSPYGWACPGGGARYPQVHYPGQPVPELVLAKVVGETGVLLGYNEPDLSSSLAAVVEDWPRLEYLCPAGSCTLVGPGPSQLDPDWYPKFYASFEERFGRQPRVDVLAVHCYFAPGAAGFCKSLVLGAVEQAAELGAGGVWVTETSVLVGLDHTVREARVAGASFLSWLDEQPEVGLYFWFAAELDHCNYPADAWHGAELFFSPCGRATSWGKWYAEVGFE